ncbi:Dissimilatory sulfite reductase D (DsrD) [Desulfonatronum thiosulfatophilum]|uniref:Dissimilatory sulfite reductase D (DsrD) n=1 Tax=Desulfonatronum thiosulfatophilum TaxID=617002 RepID=A0A1G6D7F5_9BACT|nr:dissimilatory sulfite reductase D family protein [Desulfonatronum thiosulfatophilum]SDB41030.1 Dissimilatory sulfite reductase D (DsrD) [Desulfonatronum thiosulfatophilum]
MDEAAARQAIVEGMKSKKGKSKFYFKDLTAMVPEMKTLQTKKLLGQMVNEEILEYWSSGSTTFYGLKGAGKQQAGEGE